MSSTKELNALAREIYIKVIADRAAKRMEFEPETIARTSFECALRFLQVQEGAELKCRQ